MGQVQSPRGGQRVGVVTARLTGTFCDGAVVLAVDRARLIRIIIFLLTLFPFSFALGCYSQEWGE